MAGVFAGCGGSGDDKAKGGSESLRAAALSLRQAMDSSARAIDDVHGTRASLERLGAVLQPAVSQTSDVIGLLAPKATSAGPEKLLLKAAREQRSFLQYAVDATSTRSRRSGNSAVARTRAAGRRASSAYADIAQDYSELAGVLPSSTTFNSGRILDALHAVNRRKPTKKPGATPPGPPPPPPPTSQPTDCGGGLSVNSVTSCPFAENVRDAYNESGGSSDIEVYSPVTKTTYTMTCTGGAPVICRGGNGAIVYIR
jgi:hypothetical protein